MDIVVSLETFLSYAMIVLFVLALLGFVTAIAVFEEGVSLPTLHKPARQQPAPNPYRPTDYLLTVALLASLVLLGLVWKKKRP